MSEEHIEASDSPSQPPAGGKGKTIKVTRDDLAWAENEGLVANGRADELWQGLVDRHANEPKFGLMSIIFYSGAVLAILGVLWTIAYYANSPEMLTLLSILAMAGFAGAGWFVARDDKLRVPGGLLMTLAVVMTPLVGISFMALFQVNDFTASHQLMIEGATILAGVAALQLVRFPFITMPIYASMWAMAMTLTNSFLLNSSGAWSDQYLQISMVFGAVVLVIAFLVDRASKLDYGYWGYFFGSLMLWGAWTVYVWFDLWGTGAEAARLLYFAGNIGFMVASAFLKRRILLTFGALGSVGYLGHLAYDLFADSPYFPIILLLLGVAVIVLGIIYRKHGSRLTTAMQSLIGDKRE